MQPVPSRLNSSRRGLGRDGWSVLIAAIFFVASGIIVGPVLGVLLPTMVPTQSMAPTLPAGTHFVVEGVSYRRRDPKRGEIVVFKSTGIQGLLPGVKYIKRVVGLPGEHVTIQNGSLFINDSLVVITNSAGPLSFEAPPTMQVQTNIVLGAGEYFVTGDNNLNSLDSRFYGPIQRSNITGRAWFDYWHK
jgi:signal peptidase I